VSVHRIVFSVGPSVLAVPSPSTKSQLPVMSPRSEEPSPGMYSTQPVTTKSKARIPTDTQPDTWRIVLLGDGGVGKTALATQVRALVPC
jgi:hypothetical protein